VLINYKPYPENRQSGTILIV